MKYFAMHLQDLEGEAFAIATDAEIVTWLYLHAYCCKQLNMGRIENVDSVPPKLWLRHGIEHHELLTQESPLWKLEGSTLHVRPYDLTGQELYEKQSKAGKETAARRWGKDRSANSPASSRATRTASRSSDAEETTQDNLSKTNKKTNRTKDPYTPTDDALALADWFKSTLAEDAKLSTNWRTDFAKLFDDLVRLDGRSPREIRRVAEWARNDPFWQPNFLSPNKLLKINGDGITYFDRFTEEMKAKGIPPGSSKVKPSSCL